MLRHWDPQQPELTRRRPHLKGEGLSSRTWHVQQPAPKYVQQAPKVHVKGAHKDVKGTRPIANLARDLIIRVNQLALAPQDKLRVSWGLQANQAAAWSFGKAADLHPPA